MLNAGLSGGMDAILKIINGGGEININDSMGIKSGKYSKEHIQGLIKAAKAAGVNPYDLISLSLQESGIGTAAVKKHGRYGRARDTENFLGQVADFTPEQQKELDKISQEKSIDAKYLKPALVLRDKINYAKQLGFKDEAMQLQAYNGYGKLMKQKDASGKPVATRYYGMDVPDEGLDMRKTPLYGNRLISLRGDLMKNKDIVDLISKN